jgi:asparagine synthase (glutamine-hydrolysing)
MSMAHGVEGRYPFLDHRLFEFASALPTGSRLRGLRGKEILHRWASRILPRQLELSETHGHAGPEAQSFFLPTSPSWIGDHLTSEALRRVGIFSAAAVGGLVRRCRAAVNGANEESQALIGVLSTQLWYHQFVESALFITPLPVSEASVILSDSSVVVSPAALFDPKPC